MIFFCFVAILPYYIYYTGKTVILKLLGLLALMAKAGIPIPADLGEDLNKFDTDESYKPRFDYFDPVLADIGDIQSVGSDLSTFSGHMLGMF